MRFNKISLATMVLSSGMLLAACGGGDSAPVPLLSTASTEAVINPTTGAAVVQGVLNKSFGFATGVQSFGTTSATSLTLTGSGATPSFVISSAEGSASGAMTYGSCIFKMGNDSTYPVDHPLAAGKTVTVSPCTLSVDTAGLKASETSSTSTVSFVLGTNTSSPVSVTVSVSSAGVVTVNGSIVGKTPLVAATGAGN
jgi:hypothetical protein